MDNIKENTVITRELFDELQVNSFLSQEQAIKLAYHPVILKRIKEVTVRYLAFLERNEQELNSLSPEIKPESIESLLDKMAHQMLERAKKKGQIINEVMEMLIDDLFKDEGDKKLPSRIYDDILLKKGKDLMELLHKVMHDKFQAEINSSQVADKQNIFNTFLKDSQQNEEYQEDAEVLFVLMSIYTNKHAETMWKEEQEEHPTAIFYENNLEIMQSNIDAQRSFKEKLISKYAL